MQQKLGADYVVEIGMRYGEPSIASALQKLMSHAVERLWVLPVFPQYSRAATGSAIEEFHKQVKKQNLQIPITVTDSFFDNPAYIAGFAELIKQGVQQVDAECLLFSYHGLPERQMPYNPDYQKHCFASSEMIANKLGLSANQYRTAFQSRLGRTPWIKPYTDELLVELSAGH